MSEPAMATGGETVPDAEDISIETVLARFDGDARAALRAALEDIASLQDEIAFASLMASYGFARSKLVTRARDRS